MRIGPSQVDTSPTARRGFILYEISTDTPMQAAAKAGFGCADHSRFGRRVGWRSRYGGARHEPPSAARKRQHGFFDLGQIDGPWQVGVEMREVRKLIRHDNRIDDRRTADGEGAADRGM